MEFSPANPIVKLCLQGMALKESGDQAASFKLFQQAWEESTDDPGRFLAAYYLSGSETKPEEQLRWLQTALKLALTINDDTVNSALPNLYFQIADRFEQIGQPEQTARYRELASSPDLQPADQGPFYHGTRADLQPGDHLNAGRSSNYHPGVTMNHIYFTASPNGAGLAAALAKGDGRERVYIVEPSGTFEHDPNVTDKKFPGNPTRSYRTSSPMKILGEIPDWPRMSPEELYRITQKLAENPGEIIN